MLCVHLKLKILIDLPFFVLSDIISWLESIVVGNIDDDMTCVQDATGLAAANGNKSFLLWLHSFVISRVLPWSGLQGRVATCKNHNELKLINKLLNIIF